MTLYEIKSAVAVYLGVSIADLTVDGVDMFLVAVNQVRREAEQNWDFEFQRRLVQVTVDGVTGGDLTSAVLHADGTTAVKVKTVIEVGVWDEENNLRPVEWTSVAESLERQREDNRHMWLPRSPTDADIRTSPLGVGRFEFVNDSIWRFPRDTTGTDVTLGMEVFSYAADWSAQTVVTVTGTLSPDVTGTYIKSTATYIGGSYVYFLNGSGFFSLLTYNGIAWSLFPYRAAGAVVWSLTTAAIVPAGSYTPGAGSPTGTATVSAESSTDLTTISDVWTLHGHQYLIWATVVHLNHIFKSFVPRQEGNLPPPTNLAVAGLESLKLWDSAKYEQFRRHGR